MCEFIGLKERKHPFSLHVGFLTRFPSDPSFQMGPYISNIMLSPSYRTVPLGADINSPLCLQIRIGFIQRDIKLDQILNS